MDLPNAMIDDSIRAFNFFMADFLGAMDAVLAAEGVTLLDRLVLMEVAATGSADSETLQSTLKMDARTIDRLLVEFETKGWLSRGGLSGDVRTAHAELTPAGLAKLHAADGAHNDLISRAIGAAGTETATLADALTKARLILDPSATDKFFLRGPRPGDVALVAARQSSLYAASHGWGRLLELVELETTARILRDFDDRRDRCWIADISGAMAGAVFLTDEGDGCARLRLLHVEPFARRRGIGAALVDECLSFARTVGYDKVVLWTHTVLESARRIYQGRGFQLIETAVHHEFGEPVQGETWELLLNEKRG